MKKLILLLFITIGMASFAQDKIDVVSGNFDFLKDQSEVNVQLKFDNATYQEKNLSEAQFLERRQKDITARKGEKVWKNWMTQWENFKTNEYVNYFSKGAKSTAKKIEFKKDVQTKYTLIIDAKWLYAGWYGGMIGSQKAKLSADLIFVETTNPSNILMTINVDKILGKKGNKDFSWEYGRIAAAYEILGKMLGKEIKLATK